MFTLNQNRHSQHLCPPFGELLAQSPFAGGWFGDCAMLFRSFFCAMRIKEIVVKWPLFTGSLVVALAVACASPPSNEEKPGGQTPPAASCPDGKCDAIDQRNDPGRLGLDLERNLDKLPKRGRVAVLPWPGNAWRMHHDGIAWRWLGFRDSSPIEKYDQAFGADGWRWEMKKHGTDGRQVGEWWGHCNGWAAAALLEPEPLHSVEYQGQIFEVSDIKALLVEVYYGSKAYAVGLRCNLSEADQKRDQNGRAEETACRDTNPGSFHIALLNLVGRDQRGFVMDFESADAVFNHIVTGYEVRTLAEVSEQQALELLELQGDRYPYNNEAKRFYSVETSLEYLPEHSIEPSRRPHADRVAEYLKTMTYRYLLEVDGAGVIIGGEWLGSSRHEQPDFYWLPIHHDDGRLAAGSIENPHVKYDDVKKLLDLSRDSGHQPGVDQGQEDPPVEPEALGLCEDHDFHREHREREGEQNDMATRAEGLPAGSDDDNTVQLRGTGNIYPEGDVDWYSIRYTDTAAAWLEPRVELYSTELSGRALEISFCAYYEDDDGRRDFSCQGFESILDGVPMCCGVPSLRMKNRLVLAVDAEHAMRDDTGTLYIRVATGGDDACPSYNLSYGG